ncbi:MAG TPA: PD-(D/E)XK nuclease family protein [Dermatophilaceae bacterium]|nr:PD-(D/E)XK nuclease family protein [Dermatophilaceae bacterium]
MVAALSPSRASDFMQCPLLYRFRVIDKLPSAPSAPAARGTLVHSVLERLFDLPADGRTIEAAAAMVEPQWQAMLASEPELSDLMDESDPAAVAGWFSDAVTLIEKWFTLEDPTRLEPKERELYVETDLDGLTVRGYVDRLDLTATGEMRVVDYKTGKAPLEQFEAKAWFQMKFYGLVLWRLHGRVPRMLQLVYLGGDSKILRYCPDEDELLAVERKIKALWKAIETAAETGDWQPRTSKLCDWCDHRALCPAWGGTPPPLPERAAVRALDPHASAAQELGDD